MEIAQNIVEELSKEEKLGKCAASRFLYGGVRSVEKARNVVEGLNKKEEMGK